MDARLIVDARASGTWNMAVDEVLLQAARDERVRTLRLYQWSPATISLGYFQHLAERRHHAASAQLPLVRRPSGGGAIVHDGELTYSLAIPLADDRPLVARQLLATVHQSLVELFSESGVPVVRCPPSSGQPRGAEPFLCFQRRATDDLLLGGHKVAGSAQRRQRGALLQHGSILLRASTAAPELPGIEDLAPTRELLPLLRERWPGRLAECLGWSCNPSPLTAREHSRAQETAEFQFSAERWNSRR